MCYCDSTKASDEGNEQEHLQLFWRVLRSPRPRQAERQSEMAIDLIFVSITRAFFLQGNNYNRKLKKETINPKLAMSGGKYTEHRLLADFIPISKCLSPFMCKLEKENNGKHFCCWNNL